MNHPYSLGLGVAAPLPCMGHVNYSRGGDQGSHHHVITHFLNREDAFPPEAERRDVGVIGTQLIECLLSHLVPSIMHGSGDAV